MLTVGDVLDCYERGKEFELSVEELKDVEVKQSLQHGLSGGHEAATR